MQAYLLFRLAFVLGADMNKKMEDMGFELQRVITGQVRKKKGEKKGGKTERKRGGERKGKKNEKKKKRGGNKGRTSFCVPLTKPKLLNLQSAGV
jgi:hypothetical protein